MRKGLVLICLFLLLTGCLEQKRIEDLGMSDTAAFDALKEKDGKRPDEFRIAICVPDPASKGSNNTKAYVTTASTPKEARGKLGRQTDKEIVSGQLQSLLFGRELAARGIWKLLDSYRRDYAVRERVKVVVVAGSAVDLVVQTNEHIPDTGRFIDDMLSQAKEKGEVFGETLHEFVRDYYDDGIDPIAPWIVQTGRSISFGGVALFQDDRYVGRIESEEALPFFVMYRNVKDGEWLIRYASDSGERESATISSIVSKRKVLVSHRDGKPDVVIKVRLKASLLEYNGETGLDSPEAKHILDERLSVAIQRQLQAIVDKLQQLGTDSLGIGAYVRNSMSYSQWKRMDWPGTYPETPIRVDARIHIRNYGMIQ